MFSLYKAHGVYYTDDSFYSSYPFPVEWIDSFKKNSKLGENFNTEEDIKYKPIIEKKEIFKEVGAEDRASTVREKEQSKSYRSSELKEAYSETEKQPPDIHTTETVRNKKMYNKNSRRKKVKLKKEFMKEFMTYSQHEKKELPALAQTARNNTKDDNTYEGGENSVNSQSSTQMANTIINYLNEHKIVNSHRRKNTDFN